ncbi:MAG: hypothetical protein LBG78_01395 [Azoarcus sp.]|jgi:hypothetical protein|nr:hypothetical protein [Azoarcus sp.]
MFPVLPFVAGVLVGASALSVARKTKFSPRVSETATKARQKLRQTALASLDAVHQSTGQWRDRLATGGSCGCGSKEAQPDTPEQPAVETPSRKPRGKKAEE